MTNINNNLVERGVDLEYVVVHKFPILILNSSAETHENPRPTARRVQCKRQESPTIINNMSSASCLSTFVI